MHVLFDTNVVLDVLLDRDPFAEVATQLFSKVEYGEIQGYVAAITINNLFYIIRKVKDRDLAYNAVQRILTAMHICPVNRRTLEKALNLNYKDFEDAIQLVCALENNLDIIVTRNIQDFGKSDIRIVSPTELIADL